MLGIEDTVDGRARHVGRRQRDERLAGQVRRSNLALARQPVPPRHDTASALPGVTEVRAGVYVFFGLVMANIPDYVGVWRCIETTHKIWLVYGGVCGVPQTVLPARTKTAALLWRPLVIETNPLGHHASILHHEA